MWGSVHAVPILNLGMIMSVIVAFLGSSQAEITVSMRSA